MHGARSSSLVANEAADVNSIGDLWGLSEDRGILRFVGAIREADVVILHGYFLAWTLPTAILARIYGCRVFLTPHGSLTRYQQQFSRRKKLVYEFAIGWMLRRVIAGFITGSRREAKELRERFPNSRVATAGVGTSLPLAPASTEKWHEPLSLLSLSRIAAKKRIDLSIQAVGELRKRGVPVRLIVAGDGDSALRANLVKIADELSVGASVAFVGNIEGDSKRRVIAESDVFLLPSDDENFGIAAAEAVAEGLSVVVSSQVDSMAQIDGDFCKVLQNPTGSSIADAVLALRAGERGSLRAQAIAASEAFQWSSVAATWMKLIEDVNAEAWA